ncbi:MAG: oligopeptide transporter, OPT family [Acidobacteriota bacterium]|nr:MAG: oligopeptide transporter, OPT family [Acidobacteriota bacterium]
MSEHRPYVPENTTMADWSWRGLVLGIVFGAILGSANAYLGLRVGLTISTSIPLAVIMVAAFAALRPLIGRGTILDVNIGQTAGSASSSLASGIIFTIPALFMWGLAPTLGKGWLEVALLALCGGVLGILFMIPLRPFLIVQEHKNLPYPEGTASAAVLEAADGGGAKARPVFTGLILGAFYKAILSLAQLWPGEVELRLPVLKKGLLGIEPTPALLGVGYVLGYRISAIMVAGGLLSWLGLIPLMALFGESLQSPLFPDLFPDGSTPKLISEMSAHEIWSRYVRYVGAGAVATAGIIAVIKALPVMVASVKEGLRGLAARSQIGVSAKLRTSRDLPMSFVLAGTAAVVLILALVPGVMGGGAPILFRMIASICVAVFAFLFVTVSSRIVGLVGVTSNPTSGMAIVTLIGTSVLFYSLGWTDAVGKVTVLTIGTVVCVAASIAGDISQDLKTGYLIGATPGRQQTAELLGAIVNASVIAGVVLLLGSQYGFGGADFPAPQATLMKTVIDGVLNANLPWGLVLTGAAFSLVAELLGIPSLAFAVGIYLPLSTMTPVFAGGCLKALVEWSKSRRNREERTDRGVLFASGLIAGEGVMGIGVAVAALITGQRPEGIGIAFEGVLGSAVSLVGFALLGWILFRTARKQAG